jgi:hypothetical protein
LVHEEQLLSISTGPNYDKDLTSSNPSPLPPQKPTTHENESLSQTSHRNSFSTPFSSSNLMANSPTYITLTTPKPRQRNLIPDHDPTPTKTTTSTPVNCVASERQLHFQPDISTGSTEELSSEINNAICLSYNCTQWQAEPGDADSVPPKCECEELREENSRLKATIEKLQLEQERSTSKFIFMSLNHRLMHVLPFFKPRLETHKSYKSAQNHCKISKRFPGQDTF